ncbi:jg23084 [Pararge aegeria aegeria]|uniref:Jg23084 protein n=1 Tax=Pararge aegeria aegeria TaxID=348720 RepID=A0A8S4S2L9_9NEOP|nr:jg23084 [Pararge aegeria aegeria]
MNIWYEESNRLFEKSFQIGVVFEASIWVVYVLNSAVAVRSRRCVWRSVLPVQCLCEFLSAGGAGGEAGKAGELCAHLRRTLHSEEGARAVLHYYLQRLAHSHKSTRQSANRGLKLVLSQTDDATDMDYNADVSPESWLPLLPSLVHWEALRAEAVRRVRAACLVECVPRHVAAYLGFLASHASQHDLTDIVLMLSSTEPTEATEILEEGVEGSSGCYAGEKVTLQWANGRRATLHVVVAHAHLKLLCYGPSCLDTNQEMYSWLQSTWVGSDAPEAFVSESPDEAVLLPDWLRLSLVRSARKPLLEAGLRGLPAHKLALFIQTFGMPVSSMSALLDALDACPAGAVVRLGVERGYMAQLLLVQRARGAVGGHAFAAALRLSRPQYPPDDTLFTEEVLPEEEEDPWASPREPIRLDAGSITALLATTFSGADMFRGDLDAAFRQLHGLIADEARGGENPCTRATLSFLLTVNVAALLRLPAYAAPLLRALFHAKPSGFTEVAKNLLMQCKCARGPVADALRSAVGAASMSADHSPLPTIPQRASKEQLVAAFESTTPSTLEAVGNKIIQSQDTKVVVDTITHLLDKNQKNCYELTIKVEEDEKCSKQAAHVLSVRGLGCGLLLDWLSELQRETLGTQMRLMFVRGGGSWRPLLVTLLAHRAVVAHAARLPGRPAAARLDVLIQYVSEEASEAEASEGLEAARRSIEARLPLILRCCSAPHALLAAALAASKAHPLLLLLLYMKCIVSKNNGKSHFTPTECVALISCHSEKGFDRSPPRQPSADWRTSPFENFMENFQVSSKCFSFAVIKQVSIFSPIENYDFTIEDRDPIGSV